jgi:hypothetical protein
LHLSTVLKYLDIDVGGRVVVVENKGRRGEKSWKRRNTKNFE